jgi:uncharacterized protein (TIGR03437 family)
MAPIWACLLILSVAFRSQADDFTSAATPQVAPVQAPEDLTHAFMWSLFFEAGQMQLDSLSGNLYTYANFSTAVGGLISAAQSTLDDGCAQSLVQYISNMISTAVPVKSTDTKGVSHTHLAWAGAPAPGDAAVDATAEADLYQSVAQIARAAVVLASVPKWAAQYAVQIQTYIQTVQDMVIQRFYVDQYNSTVPWLSQSPWDARSGWLAVIAASLYQATGQVSYLNLATTIGNAFKAILQPNKTGWIWDNGDILIGSQKMSTLNPKSSDAGNQEGVPDTNGATAAVSMMVLLHEAGIVFSADDVQRMANTLSDIMWNGSTTAPLISNYIDGSNKPFQFVSAPGSNAFVALGWSLLAPYTQNAQDLLTHLADAATLNPSASVTTYINSFYEPIMALYGNLIRYKMFAVPVITSASSLQANVGTPVSYQITATNNPTSYSATGLPPGLTLNATTGLISGTPTTAGSFTINLTTSNAAGTSSAITLKLTVALDPSTQLKAAGGDAQTGAVGNALSSPLVVQVTGSGGVPLAGVSVAFAVTSGVAPLSASSVSTGSDGKASVTVTLGSSPGAVTVTATVAGLSSIQFHLTAVLPPSVGTGGVVNAASNQPTLAPGSLATIYGANFTTVQTVFNNLLPAVPGGTLQCGIIGALESGKGPDSNAGGFSFTVPLGTDLAFTGGAYLSGLVSGTNSVILTLFSDSHNSPGSNLESISLVNALPSYPAAVPFISTAGSTLRAGQQYWLSAAMAQPSTSESLWCGEGDTGMGSSSIDGGPWKVNGPQFKGAFRILGAPQAQASGAPLPTSLAGVGVTVGGRLAPLLYVGPTQINFQVPYETPSGGTANVVVTANGVSSTAASATVTPASPGIFIYGNNWAVVLNQDYSLNGPSNPAKAGSYVMLYGTGAGAVSPSVPTGSAAPAAPLSTVTNVTATVNGQPATVSFQGLAPGFVGLLQVNLQVPALPSGTYPLQMTAGGAKSNSASIAVTP